MSVNKDYLLPAYVNEHTLLIASSFSGNTEETIMALKQGMVKNAKIVCITSGGKMQKIAEENGFDCILLPGDSPSPRACLGYSFIQQLYILQFFGFIGGEFEAQLQSAANLMDAETESIKTVSARWAKDLHKKMPVIYAPDGYESVAIRWRQQINENGKQLCWHHVIPEMNHNELVGWRTKDDNIAPVFFHTPDAFERTQVRIDINKTIISQYTNSIYDLAAKGANKIERMMYLVYFGDWLSWYLAQERNMDALEVKVIDYLKGELAKV